MAGGEGSGASSRGRHASPPLDSTRCRGALLPPLAYRWSGHGTDGKHLGFPDELPLEGVRGRLEMLTSSDHGADIVLLYRCTRRGCRPARRALPRAGSPCAWRGHRAIATVLTCRRCEGPRTCKPGGVRSHRGPPPSPPSTGRTRRHLCRGAADGVNPPRRLPLS